MPQPLFNADRPHAPDYLKDYNNIWDAISSLKQSDSTQKTQIAGLLTTVNNLPTATTKTAPSAAAPTPALPASVSSVGLSLPSTEFDVTGSPVTARGTLSGAWKVQLKNLVFASDPTTDNVIPTFRALVAADLPAGTTPRFADGETPGGTINGVNTAFTTAHAPSPTTSVHVYMAGLRIAPSAYSVSGSTVTFTVAPGIGTTLLFDYRY